MNLPHNFHMPVRIVFYREGESWIAHCLEFDVIGDGPTKIDAMRCLGEAVSLQIEIAFEGKTAEECAAKLFVPADGKYFAMFAKGTDALVAALEWEGRSLPSVIGRVDVREYTPDPIPA